jgi:hypothetical protein
MFSRRKKISYPKPRRKKYKCHIVFFLCLVFITAKTFKGSICIFFKFKRFGFTCTLFSTDQVQKLKILMFNSFLSSNFVFLKYALGKNFSVSPKFINKFVIIDSVKNAVFNAYIINLYRLTQGFIALFFINNSCVNLNKPRFDDAICSSVLLINKVIAGNSLNCCSDDPSLFDFALISTSCIPNTTLERLHLALNVFNKLKKLCCSVGCK